MKPRRRHILTIVALLTLGASPLFADIFAPYQGLQNQVSSAVAIFVFKLYVPPPAPVTDPLTGVYDPTNGTISGVLNPYDIEILGSLKGTLEAGTTLTARVGSFTWPTDSAKFEVPGAAIPEIGRLQPNQVYLTFMESVDRHTSSGLRATANNVELNLLKVIGKGPYRLQKNETVEQAITRLTGLRK